MEAIRFDPAVAVPSNPQQADSRDAPGWGEQIGAAFQYAFDTVPGATEETRTGNYMELYQELVRRGQKPARYFDARLPYDPVSGDRSAQMDIGRIQRDAEAFGLVAPDTDWSKQEKEWETPRAERKLRNADIIDRSSTVPWLLGSMAGSFTDPLNLATLAYGAGGGGVLRTALVEGGVNAATEALETPAIDAERRAQGDPALSAGEKLANIGVAGLAGAALPIGIHGAGKVGAKLGSVAGRAVPLDVRLARVLGKESLDQVSDADVARLFDANVPPELRLPEQQDALNVVRRQAEVDAASPFADTYEGSAANRDRLYNASATLEAGGKPAGAQPTAVTGAGAHSTVMGRIATVESGGSSSARNPRSSATGKYQFLGKTWLQLYRARFGADGLSDAQVLARRGDNALQDQLMGDLLTANTRALQRAGIPDTAGNLYLAHFAGSEGAVKLHRAAPGASARDVLGDAVVRANPFLDDMSARDVIAWADRKMGGAGNASPGPELRVFDNDDELNAALAAERADVEQGRMRAEDDAADLFDRPDDLVTPPELRRADFGSEEGWRIAQAAVDAEHYGYPDANRLPVGDTRGQGVQYHGARDDLPELTEGYYNPKNIYGGADTFYTTDALDIARGYQRGREAGAIYRIDEKAPVKTFDMEERLPSTDLQRILGEDQGGLIDMSIDDVLDKDGKANLREVMDAMREFSSGEGVSRDEVQEMFGSAIYNLQQQGYGAMSHIGGLKTNRDPHFVKIYFDAPNQLSLTKGVPSDPERVAAIPEVEAQAARISDPQVARFSDVATGGREQADGLTHDIRAQLDTGEMEGLHFATGVDGAAETPKQLLGRLDADDAALAALRACL